LLDARAAAGCVDPGVAIGVDVADVEDCTDTGDPQCDESLHPATLRYATFMGMIPARDLRNQTNEVLRRVAAGEDVTITSNGVPVATLTPVSLSKRSSMPATEFLRSLRQADPALRNDLANLAGDTTGDLGDIQ
jgi:prevent-host-death family protein